MREAAKASAAKSRQALAPTSKNVSRPRNIKSGVQKEEPVIKKEETTPQKSSSTRSTRKRAAPASDSSTSKKLKVNKEDAKPLQSPSPSDEEKVTPVKSRSKKQDTTTKAAGLKSKKLKQFAQYSGESPFPNFKHPTPEESHLGLHILSKLHGLRQRPAAVTAPTSRAGCGDSPSVLDALVRTILSQNTSDANSTRAKLSMDEVYGGSDEWAKIVKGGQAKLQEAIKCGGLSVVKSKVIISILNQVHEKYGKYSLDHLHEASTEAANEELISFQGVGPKTASCVLMFCLRRESFAVDTHVWRITGLLGWRPQTADREMTQAHLEVKIPDEDKYGLHVLLVSHGKRCEECKAGGRSAGKCELRKAFRKIKEEGSIKDEDLADEVKEETED